MGVLDMSQAVKRQALDLGAALCGIADADRFAGAPAGHHPHELLPGSRSVIVVAKPFPVDELSVASIQYTDARDRMTLELNDLAKSLAAWLVNQGSRARPIDSMGNGVWEADGRFRDVLSLKHSAHLAGLGIFGKNQLIINDRYGNMVWFAAVITDLVLQADEGAAYQVCPPGCNLCLKSCPSGALGGELLQQATCYRHAYRNPLDENGQPHETIVCNTCRVVCPNAFGLSRERRELARLARAQLFPAFAVSE